MPRGAVVPGAGWGRGCTRSGTTPETWFYRGRVGRTVHGVEPHPNHGSTALGRLEGAVHGVEPHMEQGGGVRLGATCECRSTRGPARLVTNTTGPTHTHTGRSVLTLVTPPPPTD